MLIPVPAPLCGAIVVGESVVTYFSAGAAPYQRSAALRQTIVRVRALHWWSSASAQRDGRPLSRLARGCSAVDRKQHKAVRPSLQ
jgi:hypothetical protein